MIARVHDDQTLLDLRSVDPADDHAVAAAPLPDHAVTVIATAGHVDHGKSALIEALTGTNPDRLAEENAAA